MAIDDINKDGKYEILINDHDALKCFDEDLNLMWSHSGNGESSCPVLADVNGDGYLDVIGLKGISKTDGGLMVVSGKDGSMMKDLPNIGLPTHMTPTVYDIDLDGHLELLTAYGTEIYVYDLITEQVKTKLQDNGHYYRASHAPCIGNVMNNNQLEIIVDGSWDGSISIWDYNYNKVASVPAWGSLIYVDDIDGDGYNEIIIAKWYNNLGEIICYGTGAISNNANTYTNYYGYRRTGAEVPYPDIS